jgi:hypothetical protein
VFKQVSKPAHRPHTLAKTPAMAREYRIIMSRGTSIKLGIPNAHAAAPVIPKMAAPHMDSMLMTKRAKQTQ